MRGAGPRQGEALVGLGLWEAACNGLLGAHGGGLDGATAFRAKVVADEALVA